MGVSYVGGASGLTLLIIAIVGVIVIAGWVLLAASRFLQGGNVERPERVPQLYGYTVCLVSVLVAFASVVTLADNLITLAAPAHPRGEMAAWAEPSVTSFEAFRVSYDRVRQMNVGPGVATEPISEDELRRRYEGMRTDRIERTRVAAYRSLIKAAFTLLVASLLFLIHWRWLKRRVDVAGMTTSGGTAVSMLLLFWPVACVHPRAQAEADSAQTVAAIEVLSERWIEAFELGDAEASAAFFTEDAIYAANNGELLRGREEIHDAMSRGPVGGRRVS